MRSTAARALRTALTDPGVYEAVVALRADPKSVVRVAGRRTLQEAARDPRIHARLIAQLPRLATPDLWYVADALVARPPPPVLARWLLIQLRNPAQGVIWDGFPLVRALAAQPAVRDQVLPGLGARDAFIRQRTVWILGPHAADPIIRAALLGLAEDPVVWVRAAVAQTLAPHAADPQVQALLLRYCADPQAGPRAAAAQALAARAQDPGVADGVRRLLRDPDGRVRVAAVGALAPREPGPDLWAVIEPVIRERTNLSRQAVAVVGPLAQEPAVRTYLGQLLADREAGIRQAAARALAEATPEAGLREALGVRCADADAWVADAAYTTLTAWAAREAAG